VEAGVLGGQWSGIPTPEDWEMEWNVLEDDLIGASNVLVTPELTRLQQLYKSSWEQGERVLFVPTFYAWGRVPA